MKLATHEKYHQNNVKSIPWILQLLVVMGRLVFAFGGEELAFEAGFATWSCCTKSLVPCFCWPWPPQDSGAKVMRNIQCTAATISAQRAPQIMGHVSFHSSGSQTHSRLKQGGSRQILSNVLARLKPDPACLMPARLHQIRDYKKMQDLPLCQ